MSISKMNAQEEKCMRPTVKISKDDEYVYMDFLREGGEVFDSLEDLCKWFTTQFPRVFARIEEGTGYYLKKDSIDNPPSTIPFLNEDYQYSSTVQIKNKLENKTNSLKFADMYKNFLQTTHGYSNVAYKPRDYLLGKYEFNMWEEFVGYREVADDSEEDNVEVVTEERLTAFIDFLKHIICKDDEACFVYLRSWLRHIVKSPWSKTEVCMFLQSTQGCGKGFLSKFLSDVVFGQHCSSVICGLLPLVQKHNFIVAKKSFLFIDELPTQSGEFHSAFDKMKHYITEDKIYVEPKGREGYNIDNRCNFMMSSNNVFSLKVEATDRRYFCLQVSDEKRGDKKYWDYMFNDVLNDEVGVAFCKYLLDTPDDECVSLKDIPNTELREQLKNNSKCVSHRFFDDIVKGDFTFNVKYNCIPEFKNKKMGVVKYGITPDQLYTLFKGYCEEYSERAMKKKVFFSSIQDIISCNRAFVKGKNYRVYNLGDIGFIESMDEVESESDE